MFRVADFAKSSVKDENIYDEAEDNLLVEDHEPALPPISAGRYIDNPDEYNFEEDFKFGGGHGSYEDEKKPPFSADFKFVPSDTMGMPTGFSVGHVEKQRKGEKKTFYCEMCLVELSSLDTMKSHVSGVKHMKKQMALSNDREEKVRRGLMTEEEAIRSEPRVKPIPNPESTKKKIPIRLHEKIRETLDPVVGLRFVKEFIAVSDPEMEPHYECELCGSMGQSNGMFSHLMGHKHRQLFVERLAGDSRDLVNLSQAELLRKAKKHSENHMQLSSLIRTRRSDEEYPWPPGKAPWAVERGGSGIPPDGARDNYGKNSHGAQAGPVSKLPNALDERVSVAKLPAPGMVKPPQSREEAERMLDMARKLVSMAVECDASGVRERDGRVIQSTLEAVMMKMQQNMSRGRGERRE